MKILAGFVLSLFILAACVGVGVPVEKRLKSAQVTLQAVEDTIPELVLSGDLTEVDQLILIKAIDKAQVIVDTAVNLSKSGQNSDAVSQFGLAIDILRTARNEVKSENVKQDISRTIAVLTLTKSILEANQ